MLMTLLIAALLSQDPPPPAGRPVTLTRLDGSGLRGRLVSLAPGVTLETAQGPVQLAWSEVLSIQPLGAPGAASAPARRAPLRFELADGSAFAGRISGVSGEGIVVRFGGRRSCRIALNAIGAIVSTWAGPAARREIARARKLPAPTEDLAIVARGQEVLVVPGSVRRVGSEGVRFSCSAGELHLPWERLAALRFARPAARGSSSLVRLADGDVFAGRVVAGDGQSLTLQSGIFEKLVLAWSAIERIDCRSDRLVFLSDLRPQRYEFEPFFVKRWEYARDATLSGGPIVLGGRHYPKGISMHSRAALSYRLDGAFRRFAASVGIPDEMDGRGCVTLKLLGDGEVLWQAGGVRGGQAPRQVLVEVGGVDELVLIVDYDEDLDLSDQACWAFARLIR